MNSSWGRYALGVNETTHERFHSREFVRWSDVDKAGIICYGAYVRFFEIAETELFRSVGYPYSKLFDHFDLWLINTGYQYPVEDDLSLYMEAGPAIGPRSDQTGFNISSGVRYRLSPSLNIGSQLKQLEVSKASTLVELNSSLLVTPQLAITANYGLSAFSTEHFLTLGVGFNF